jgi:hypothetical protein
MSGNENINIYFNSTVARSELIVAAVLLMKVQVLRAVTLCRQLNTFGCFGGAIAPQNSESSRLLGLLDCSYETSVTI